MIAVIAFFLIPRLLGLLYILKFFLPCLITHYTFTGGDQDKARVYSRVLDLRDELLERDPYDDMDEELDDIKER